MSKVIICGRTVENQKQLSAELMIKYIEENYPQDKKWFKENSFAEMADITFVEKKDKDGNVIYKTSKNGKKIKSKEAIKTGKSKKFNIARARKVFCERYFKELVKKEKTITDLLKDW